jgi:hypothetical protein
MSDTYVIFKKLPKENHYPLGENSPNLVTLHSTNVQIFFFQFLYFRRWPSCAVLRDCLSEKLLGVLFPEIPFDERFQDLHVSILWICFES